MQAGPEDGLRAAKPFATSVSDRAAPDLQHSRLLAYHGHVGRDRESPGSDH
jgi:hypothetical protein